MSAIENIDYETEDTQKDKFLTFFIGSEQYAIPIKHVSEIIGMLKITPVPQMPVYFKGVINLRGKVIPVMDIRLRFGLSAKDYDERTCVIVVNFDNLIVGFVVDTVSEVLDITPDKIEHSQHMTVNTADHFIKGMGKVGDSIKMIVDINALLKTDTETLLKENKMEGKL